MINLSVWNLSSDGAQRTWQGGIVAHAQVWSAGRHFNAMVEVAGTAVYVAEHESMRAGMTACERAVRRAQRLRPDWNA